MAAEEQLVVASNCLVFLEYPVIQTLGFDIV